MPRLVDNTSDIQSVRRLDRNTFKVETRVQRLHPDIQTGGWVTFQNGAWVFVREELANILLCAGQRVFMVLEAEVVFSQRNYCDLEMTILEFERE